MRRIDKRLGTALTDRSFFLTRQKTHVYASTFEMKHFGGIWAL